MEAQFAHHLVEPNSGLGKAITYFLRHWKGLTAFLREAGAPLDNNICERALKRAVLHRKNALFYRTLHGSEVGDLFMSLIHTCELAGANPFDYLTQLQRHAARTGSQSRRRGCPGTTSNKLSPATIISFRPLSATLRKCPQNASFRSLNPARFLATPFGLAFMPAFPRTINRHCRCRSAPCANTPPSETGPSPCKSKRSAPARRNGSCAQL